MFPAEHSRRSRARQRDDEIVRFRSARSRHVHAPCEMVSMSALGQKQTYALQKAMSALPLKADIRGAKTNVRFGPKADIGNDYDLSGSNATTRGKITRLAG